MTYYTVFANCVSIAYSYKYGLTSKCLSSVIKIQSNSRCVLGRCLQRTEEE